MLFRLFILIILINLEIFATAQNNPTLFSVDNRKIGLNDFKLAFKDKYGADKLSDKQLVRKFLNERINFIVKVQEAKALKLDKNKNFKKQLSNFKKFVIETHMTDSKLLNKLTLEAYQRMQVEIELMQILFRVSPFATPADTLLAYKKALAVRSLILEGKDFGELARQVSDAPFSSVKSGSKAYVRVFDLPYSVENYIYAKYPTTCSFPIRSHEGYHLVKILNKRKNPGHFKLAHILIRLANDSDQIAAMRAEQKIKNVYNLYKSGKDFNALAEKYSDDFGSEAKSSPLSWFSTGMMPKEFTEQCIKLRNNEVSKPFKTRFGWHIIKRIDQRDLPEYKFVKEQLEQRVMADRRSRIVKQQIIRKLKSKYHYQDFRALAPIIEMVNDTIFDAKWIAKGCDVFTDKLCQINGKTYYQSDFIKYLQDNQEKRFPIPIDRYVNLRYNDFVNNILLDNEAKYIEKNNKEIAKTLQNYEDIILVSALNARQGNTKPQVSDIELEDYYNQNKDKYNRTYQVDMSIFSYASNLKKVEKLIRKLKKKHASDQEVVARVKASRDMLFQLDERIVAKEGENIYVDNVVQLFKDGKLSFDDKLIIFANEKKIIWLNSHINKTNSELNEVKDKVLSDYNDYNSDKLVNKIKQKHHVVVNEELLNF